MNYTIEKITTLIGARRVGTTDAQIGWLLYLNVSMYLSCFLAQVHHFLLLCLKNLAAGALK